MYKIILKMVHTEILQLLQLKHVNLHIFNIVYTSMITILLYYVCELMLRVPFKNGIVFLALACQCNGHSSCVNTSTCEDCQNNTNGSNCERCQAGFWGDSRNGGTCQGECHLCMLLIDEPCSVRFLIFELVW